MSKYTGKLVKERGGEDGVGHWKGWGSAKFKNHLVQHIRQYLV